MNEDREKNIQKHKQPANYSNSSNEWPYHKARQDTDDSSSVMQAVMLIAIKIAEQVSRLVTSY